jgi:circadian clock protein KaiC
MRLLLPRQPLRHRRARSRGVGPPAGLRPGVAVDSLSALERVSSIKRFREFVISLTSFIKHRELAGLSTATTPELMGGTSVSEAHISSITDSIILLRYVEIFGEMRRGVTVLKMRGSTHQNEIREFTIDNTGMHIGPAFRNVSGILSGRAVHAASDELSRLDEMFQDGRPGGHSAG